MLEKEALMERLQGDLTESGREGFHRLLSGFNLPLTVENCLEIFNFLIRERPARVEDLQDASTLINPQIRYGYINSAFIIILMFLNGQRNDYNIWSVGLELSSILSFCAKQKQSGVLLDWEMDLLRGHEMVQYYVEQLGKENIDPIQSIIERQPRLNIDKLFEVFNIHSDDINKFRLGMSLYIRFGLKIRPFSNTGDGPADAVENPHITKLYLALKHFADKNQDGKLSQEQMEMLKTSNAFLDRFSTLLPELFQVGFVADITNRHNFQKEAFYLTY
jgi:hypothetical protein